MAQLQHSNVASATNPAKRVKLTGRAFYESIGSPDMIVAPMVDRSEFAWRLLTRSYLDPQRSKKLLAYTPMFHARLFREQAKFRDAHFQPTKESLTSCQKNEAPPYLDGRPDIDRPLFVQFCANKSEDFFEAAQYVAPYCDAVDLNLGCPQGIAKSGGYGAFLQEDWATIQKLIRKLKEELDVPVTAKFRILETKEKTLEYAKTILDAGASIITVHGRQRHQKGHNTGVADWETIRYLRDNLPPETVLFANGNVLNGTDIGPCLDATKADGIMSAEGNLSDPTIFARAPEDPQSREYWQDPNNPSIAGYRIDGVFRRYIDIIYRYVLQQEPPRRKPLYIPGDTANIEPATATSEATAQTTGVVNTSEISSGTKRPVESMQQHDGEDVEQDSTSKQSKKQKTKRNGKAKNMAAVHNPNLKSMQGHLFQLLRPLIGSHVPIRDALAQSRAGDIQAFENVLSMVEEAVRTGLDEEHSAYHTNTATSPEQSKTLLTPEAETDSPNYKLDKESSQGVRERCRRPFWVCQPHIRPLPEEAVKLGAMTVSKKNKEALTAKNNAQTRDPVPVRQGTKTGDAESQAVVAQSLVSSQNIYASSAHNLNIMRQIPQDEALPCG